MNDNNNSSKDIDTEDKKNEWSLLEEILKSQEHNTKPSDHWEATETIQTTPATNNIPTPETTIRKPQESISFATFMKLAGSILFVAIIFLGSFWAYIVLNPEDSVFLIKNLNIDPNDVAIRLKQLINGTFWTIIFILSIVWIISLFKAFWTPKDLKRKKMLAWLSAWLIGILLFSVLSFWIYIFSKIQTIDFPNLAGDILIYDNDLYIHEETKENAQLTDGTNIIWPITLLFDIRANAKAVSREYLVTIDSYSIDSDGGICNDGTSTVMGNNVTEEKSIICTFDKIKTYNIKGIYNVTARNGEKQTISMKISPIEIRGIVAMKRSKNISGENIITLDASELKKMGNPRWLYLQSNKTVESTSITEKLSEIPQYICFKIMSETCDRLFVLEDTDTTSIKWTINAEQDAIDPLLFHFSLSGVSIDQNQVTSVEWLLVNEIWGKSLICKKWGYTCDYPSSGYGKYNIQVEIRTANDQKYTLESSIQIQEPLKLTRNMKVLDPNGNILNTKDTYQSSLKAYVIENVLTPPANITLDGRDIAVENEWYSLESVVWKIRATNNGEVQEKRWDKVDITLDKPTRYTIEGSYSFKKSTDGSIETAKDIVIIDIERKSLMPRIKTMMSSDYTPSIVTIDASESESVYGEIKKFIFDFWEGKTPAEGDAIQTYEYVTPWEKEITVTIIAENGEKATTKKTIILKDEARKIDFAPSMTPWVPWATVDFEAAGTNGQVQDYIWNFGDGTPAVRGYSVSHIFSQTGTYTIGLTVVYTDGTRKTESRKYEVSD